MAALVAVALSTTAAPAVARTHQTICERAYGARQTVVKKYNRTTAGRNVCRFKMRNGLRPSIGQRARYLHALERLAAPPPYSLGVHPGGPALWVGGTYTVHYAPIGLAACVARVESSDGVNQSPFAAHSGWAQWSHDAWKADGGLAFAAVPTAASTDDQLLVLSTGLRKFGCSQWCPFENGQCG